MSATLKIVPTKVQELPVKIPYELLVKELTDAHAAIGELRGFLGTLHNPDLLIAPFRKREAVASSAIEGTRATLEEVLEYEAGDKSRKDPVEAEQNRKIQDILEVRNYESAMSVAMTELKKKPIAENLLKKTHNVLLNSVRGRNKNKGNFRKEQVTVGDYVPPVHTDIPHLMSNWENYLNSNSEEYKLIRIGVAHYQFEAIHPFLDGNGRIGRLIIPLFLCQEDLLQTPVLFISHYLEEHKQEYQKLLHKIDTDQDWVPWLKFFLIATATQARATTMMAKDIQDLYERLKREVVPTIRSQHGISILDHIFVSPITNAADVKNALLAKSKGTTYNLLKKYVELGVLDEVKIHNERLYVFTDLLKILRM